MWTTAADLVRLVEIEAQSARAGAPTRSMRDEARAGWGRAARGFGSRGLRRLADAIEPRGR